MPVRPTSEILTIGDELLKGSTLNTNAYFLAEHLSRLGFDAAAQQTCSDQMLAIQHALRLALSRSDVVILTGGLGPTPDDITRESLADFFNVPLKFSNRQYSQIVKYFKKRRPGPIPKEWRREAEFPANAVQLPNRFGVALGFYIRVKTKLIIVLPGVPREMRRMFIDLVEPLLVENFTSIKNKHRLTAKFVGLGETQVMQKLGAKFVNSSFDFGIYPALGEVTLRLQSDKKKVIADAKKKVQSKLGPSIYAMEETSFVQVIGDLLVRKKATLGVAESCTGGQLAAEFTSIAGSSSYFDGGLIVYTNELKKLLAGVKASSLNQYGAVSTVVAKELALGVCERLGSDYGLGVTGIAGPGGGSKKKPVGTVFIGLATPRGTKSYEFYFGGERPQVQRRSVVKAMELLWRELRR